ncbi:MAG: hypothetical protein JW811_10040 [Clostridiales bacterium]|nr:hypothetical protein [Clostridiales bacterium]
MRLLENMKQTVTVKPAAAAGVYQEDDRLYRFDGSRAFLVRAVLQPLTERPDAAVYGETPTARLLMLYDGDETLDEGMGVCVDVISSSPCDYRISEMPRRYQSHKELTLAFIPEELRA